MSKKVFFHEGKSLAGSVFIWCIRKYQKYLSPLKRYPTCRFYPVCSVYAIEAIQKFGAVKGFFLAFYRILRCNPFCRGGYDPVPEKKTKLKRYRK